VGADQGCRGQQGDHADDHEIEHPPQEFVAHEPIIDIQPRFP
jgi:hypothetical protein